MSKFNGTTVAVLSREFIAYLVGYYAYRAALIEEALQLADGCVLLERKGVSNSKRRKFERDEKRHVARVQRFERITGISLDRIVSFPRMEGVGDASKLMADNDPLFKKRLEKFQSIYKGQSVVSNGCIHKSKVLGSRMARSKANGNNRTSRSSPLFKSDGDISNEVISGAYCSEGLGGLSEKDKAQAFVRQIALSLSYEGLFSSQDVWERLRKEYPGINVSVEAIDRFICAIGGFALADVSSAEGKRFFQSTRRPPVLEKPKKRRRGRDKKRRHLEIESPLVQERKHH